ncbi:HET-domain-containing protein [Lophiostoma macrostomum CBS 122681]|uniref:HET-domain-containing protein n=1 Tax=Lophiostoma macrostomum CBS 122681 TaxID=1314788 RepID=A0A6A6T8W7_9PLEO|nr:HET-domain-containing protein [Lophiostoma macrostomum CBS 122681]
MAHSDPSLRIIAELSVEKIKAGSRSKTPSSTITSSLSQSQEEDDLIRHWVTDCVGNHSSCGRGRSRDDYVPSRLVHIGACGSMWTLHLASRGEILSHKYISLSYRWGSYQQLKLTTENLDQFRSENHISSLPKTFRDLFYVARLLSVDYIWIDSLCIIQDSVADWEFESRQMRSVYANSYCTVAASWGSDPTSGLYQHRSLQPALRCAFIKTNWESLQNADLDTLRVFPFDGWNQTLCTHPLHSRGWALQERYLSARVLYFTRDQILWECDKHRLCQLFPYDAPEVYTNAGRHRPRLSSFIGRDSPDQQIAMSTELHTAWHDIVRLYSQAKLTKVSDKFVALDGLVKLFAQLSGDTYIAGLWLSTLWEDLLWCTYGWDNLQRYSEYVAPTWSWASVNGPVWYSGYFENTVYPTQLSSYQIQTSSKLPGSKGTWIYDFLELRGYAPSFVVDAPYKWETVDEELQTICTIDVGKKHLMSATVFFLLLRLSPHPNSQHYTGEGIALVHAENSTEEFVRVGRFSIEKESEKHLNRFGMLRTAAGDVIVDPSVEKRTFKII